MASTRVLRDNGAHATIMGSSQSKLEGAQAELGGDVLATRGDVMSLEDLARMRPMLEDAFGTLDILFANAGTEIGVDGDRLEL